MANIDIYTKSDLPVLRTCKSAAEQQGRDVQRVAYRWRCCEA